jgi:hypothetical protein
VVNRSEVTEKDTDIPSLPKTHGSYLDITRSRRDEVDFNELSINLKISYKTILLIVVAFNVAHRLIEFTF